MKASLYTSGIWLFIICSGDTPSWKGDFPEKISFEGMIYFGLPQWVEPITTFSTFSG